MKLTCHVDNNLLLLQSPKITIGLAFSKERSQLLSRSADIYMHSFRKSHPLKYLTTSSLRAYPQIKGAFPFWYGSPLNCVQPSQSVMKRSSSLEYIELIPDSTPPPLDSSVSSTSTTVQRESQITTDQHERLEGAGGEVHDDSGPRHLNDRGPAVPPGAAGGTAVAVAAAAADGGGAKERASSTSR